MFLQQGRTSKCSENKAQSVHPLWYMTLSANYIMKRDKDIYIYIEKLTITSTIIRVPTKD